MKIAFCTTCKGRLDHLRQTLAKNLEDSADFKGDAVFVVLDYSGQDRIAEYVAQAHRADLEHGRVVVYTYPHAGAFHLSHAKNMAARCGMREGADVLVTLDADNFVGHGFAQFVVQAFRDVGFHPGIFLAPNVPYIRSLAFGPPRPCRGYFGRLALCSKDFLKLGGYDEIFEIWGSEDVDLLARLERLGYTKRFFDIRHLQCLPHSTEVRFKEYPHAQVHETDDHPKAIEGRTETVVNFGRFGLGTVYRNLDRTPMALSPLPTRVFGIGMHKTATTSIHRAFQILGYDSFHWGTGQASPMWYEMQGLGRSKTLEQWYALSDLPIPLLYRELDTAYPGSKFILTIRHEEQWIQSIERLWDATFNPTRWEWDVYPFSHEIHTALYGQRHFDRETFLARYRRHNFEVLEYFKARPHDLLVLDMDAGGRWNELCAFLRQPIPRVAYPTANRSRRPSDVGRS